MVGGRRGVRATGSTGGADVDGGGPLAVSARLERPTGAAAVGRDVRRAGLGPVPRGRSGRGGAVAPRAATAAGSRRGRRRSARPRTGSTQPGPDLGGQSSVHVVGGHQHRPVERQGRQRAARVVHLAVGQHDELGRGHRRRPARRRRGRRR